MKSLIISLVVGLTSWSAGAQNRPVEKKIECRDSGVDCLAQVQLSNAQNLKNFLDASRQLDHERLNANIKAKYLNAILQSMRAEERISGKPSKIFTETSISETLRNAYGSEFDERAVSTIEDILADFRQKLNRHPETDPEIALIGATVDYAEYRFRNDPEKAKKIPEFVAGVFDGCLFIRPGTKALVGALATRGQK